MWIPSVASAINSQFLKHSIDVKSMSSDVSGNLGKSLNLSEPRVSHLYKRGNDSIVLTCRDCRGDEVARKIIGTEPGRQEGHRCVVYFIFSH